MLLWKLHEKGRSSYFWRKSRRIGDGRSSTNRCQSASWYGIISESEIVCNSGSCEATRRNTLGVKLAHTSPTEITLRLGYRRGIWVQLTLQAICSTYSSIFSELPKWAHERCNSVSECICSSKNDDGRSKHSRVSSISKWLVNGSTKVWTTENTHPTPNSSFSNRVQGSSSRWRSMFSQPSNFNERSWWPRVLRTAWR